MRKRAPTELPSVVERQNGGVHHLLKVSGIPEDIGDDRGRQLFEGLYGLIGHHHFATARLSAVGTSRSRNNVLSFARTASGTFASGARAGPALWPRSSMQAFMMDTSNPFRSWRSS